ncbi:MAG: hypothetical protein LBT14_06045 [Treponema sp.]|jgi:L-ribulose-5-phosphate 3-epimerase UlaE|nr:hypothetical protein [Treponema sp.]
MNRYQIGLYEKAIPNTLQDRLFIYSKNTTAFITVIFQHQQKIYHSLRI